MANKTYFIEKFPIHTNLVTLDLSAIKNRIPQGYEVRNSDPVITFTDHHVIVSYELIPEREKSPNDIAGPLYS
ncbi:hypothetical protein [Xanthocytophaga agilis]|uniref:Uncharacterized protein n=1 Tax=Xanthocytophaga agilis TaxID=3048010 RepID=A0AAE3R3D5_9BACT|nr:hypothetical protein [Xanthocytophaga agilis]MDJ1500650.1 hypothetical protein [Xanthocytophaga agilis]